MNKHDDEDTMRDNYTREDLGPLVRGKYHAAYNQGINTVTVHYTDGTSKTTILDGTLSLQKPVDGGK